MSFSFDVSESTQERRITAYCGSIAALWAPGRKPPVLLLHGNSSCKEAFEPAMRALAEAGHECLACDLPGHGASDDAREPEITYTFAGYARAVRELIDSFEWTDPCLVGWSLGGHIALEAMAGDPRIRSAMLIGSPPGDPSPETFCAAFFDNPTTRLAGQKDFTSDEARDYGAAMLGCDPHLHPRLARQIARADGRAREIMFQSAMRGEGAGHEAVARDPSRPLAIVCGENDPFVRVSYLKTRVYGKLWRDAVQVIPGAGHAPHFQSPEAFNPLLLNFLQWLKGWSRN